MGILGEYTVTYLGEEAGKLSITEKGLLTVFSCICQPVSKSVLRLYCKCGSDTVPIGVMTPCSKNLTLSKSFSKNALSDMRLGGIDSAFLSADGRVFPGGTESVKSIKEKRQNEEKTGKEAPARSERKEIWREEPEPWRLFSDEELSLSCRRIKGAMSRFEEDMSFLAVPISPYEPFPPMPIFCFGSKEEIDGRDYIVFKMQNGRFVK